MLVRNEEDPDDLVFLDLSSVPEEGGALMIKDKMFTITDVQVIVVVRPQT